MRHEICRAEMSVASSGLADKRGASGHVSLVTVEWVARSPGDDVAHHPHPRNTRSVLDTT